MLVIDSLFIVCDQWRVNATFCLLLKRVICEGDFGRFIFKYVAEFCFPSGREHLYTCTIWWQFIEFKSIPLAVASGLRMRGLSSWDSALLCHRRTACLCVEKRTHHMLRTRTMRWNRNLKVRCVSKLSRFNCRVLSRHRTWFTDVPTNEIFDTQADLLLLGATW